MCVCCNRLSLGRAFFSFSFLLKSFFFINLESVREGEGGGEQFRTAVGNFPRDVVVSVLTWLLVRR